jgi:lincosamide nucleotidyltransferase A/C/D/E
VTVGRAVGVQPGTRRSVPGESGIPKEGALASVVRWVAHQRHLTLYARIMRTPVLRAAAKRLGESVARAPAGSPVQTVLERVQMRFGASFKAAEVVRAVEALEDAGIDFWIAGGWGIEALVGRRQKRVHHDLDLVIDNFERFADAACQALAPAGYRLVHTRSLAVWMPDRRRLQNDDRQCTIDLLSIDWRRLAKGLGIAVGRDVRPSELLETVAFSQGFLKGRPVPCLSPTVQLLYHTGFELRPEHKRDVNLVRSLLDSSDGDGDDRP